jgi:hypothetical protein
MFGKGHMLLHRSKFINVKPVDNIWSLTFAGKGSGRGKGKIIVCFLAGCAEAHFSNLHSSNVRNQPNPPCVSTLMITSTMT